MTPTNEESSTRNGSLFINTNLKTEMNKTPGTIKLPHILELYCP